MTDRTAPAPENGFAAAAPSAAVRGRRRRQQPPRSAGYRAYLSFLPLLVLVALVLASLTRTGVAGGDIVRYSLYWLVAVVVPGKVVSRALLGVRRTVIEDLALATATGVALEVLFWVVGVVTGIGHVAGFWWIPVLLAGLAVPALRRATLARVPDRIGVGPATGLAAITWLVLMQFDLTGFRFSPLPPRASGLFADQWWHLSLVQEMMRYESPQTPQVVGTAFHYHYFADVQMGSGARLSGVAAEVVLLRLWPVAATLLCVGLGFALGRALTGSTSWAVLTTGLMFAVPAVGYIWPSVGTFAPSVFSFISPTQIMADFGVVVSALAIIVLLRAGPSPRLVAWAAIIVVGNSGDKATVIPILAAGVVLALIAAVVTRSWVSARLLGAITGALFVVGLVIFGVAAGTTGGKPIVLGTLRAFPAFTNLVPTPTLRGVNTGLLLDSIDSPRAAAIAVLVTAVLLAVHGVRLVGIAGLARKHLRADLTVWFLAGAVVAGYAAVLAFEQIGFSQTFFAATAAPLGAALTVYMLHDAVTRSGADPRRLLLTGLVLGVGTALVVRAVVAIRKTFGGYATLDQLILPPVVVIVVAVIGWFVWRRVRHGRSSDTGWALVLAAALGLALPTLATTTWDNAVAWTRPVDYQVFEQAGRVTEGELSGLLWLRDHSSTDDVIMSDGYCLPTGVRPMPNCSARGFWVSGLTGRRVVQDGWAYTPEAATGQGIGGRTYAFQPSPFTERARLNAAVFTSGDVAALEQLRRQYDVRWVVAIDRAGPPPRLPSDVARKRFDNGAVTIYEVLGGTSR